MIEKFANVLATHNTVSSTSVDLNHAIDLDIADESSYSCLEALTCDCVVLANCIYAFDNDGPGVASARKMSSLLRSLLAKNQKIVVYAIETESVPGFMDYLGKLPDECTSGLRMELLRTGNPKINEAWLSNSECLKTKKEGTALTGPTLCFGCYRVTRL